MRTQPAARAKQNAEENDWKSAIFSDRENMPYG
jgi:hypothetical protein